jgi:DNA-directed RNA polymerase subunit omega
MIELLRSTELAEKVGGKYKLTVLVQKRLKELMQGARPLIANPEGKTQLEIVIEEIMTDKITPDFEAGGTNKPAF